MKPDLSIVLPGIRTNLWKNWYDSVLRSVGHFKYEIIAVGPYEPPDSLKGIGNFTYIKDFGSPARCVQLGASVACGNFMKWSSDDAIYRKDSLQKLISFCYSLGNKDIVAVRYTEGKGRTGTDMPVEWFTARHHADQRLPGILDNYNIAPVATYNLEYFRELGGLDCRFNHINMNTHDLAFRAQKDGATVYISPFTIMDCDWYQDDWGPVWDAYQNNDLPLFNQLYAQFDPNRIKIDFDNWKQAEPIWSRRKF